MVSDRANCAGRFTPKYSVPLGERATNAFVKGGSRFGEKMPPDGSDGREKPLGAPTTGAIKVVGPPAAQDVLAAVMVALKTRYPWEAVPKKQARFLMAAAVLRIAFPLDTVLPGPDALTLQSAAEYGFCVLQPATEKRMGWTVSLPFLLLAIWASESALDLESGALENRPAAILYRDIANSQQVEYWQHFEMVIAKQLAARIASHGEFGLNRPTMRLADIIASPEAAATEFPAVPWCRVEQSAFQWPGPRLPSLPAEHLDGRHVLVMAAGNPGVDVVVPLKGDGGKVFWLLVQLKHTQAERKLTKTDITVSLDKFWQALETHAKQGPKPTPQDSVFVVVTNRALQAQLKHEAPGGVLPLSGPKGAPVQCHIVQAAELFPMGFEGIVGNVPTVAPAGSATPAAATV